MTVPKLLSFITISTCLCQSIIAMQTFRTAPLVHTTGGVPRDARAQIGLLADFKHPYPNHAGRVFSGPEEIPKKYHLKTLPYEAFPENEKLQALAAQQALWINYYHKPLSTRPTSGWSEYADIYGKLNLVEKENLQAWLKTNVIKESRSKAIFAERINWYLLASDETIRWGEKHFKDANLLTNEDIHLTQIGEILQLLPGQQGRLQFIHQNPKATALQLHGVLFNSDRDLSRTLRLDLLAQIRDNEGTSLYKKSMAALTNQLWEMIPTMSNREAKRKLMQVLFSAYGDAPVNAEKYASTTLKKIREDPALWTQLPHGTWDESKESLATFKKPLQAI